MRILIIRVLVYAAWVVQTQGQNAKGPPDLTMLYEGKTSTCVATGNTIGSGLALVTPMVDNGASYEFEYKDENGMAINTSFNCDFESESNEQCNQWSVFSTGRKENSGIINFPPVIDERWNKFEIYRTFGKTYSGYVDHKYDKYWNLQEKSYLGISVRAQNNSHIVLCEEGNPRNKYNKCYWIILDGFDDFDISVIRKCYGVPDISPTDNDCRSRRSEIQKKLLDESKWKHFLLERDYDGTTNKLLLWSWDENYKQELLLNFTDDSNSFNAAKMFLRSYKTMAEWKVHEYKYVRFQHHDGPKQPILITDNLFFNPSLCLSMYIGLCPNCKMTLEIIEDGEDQSTNEAISGEQNFYTWKNIKLQNSTMNTRNRYKLYARLEGTNGFWAIDDIRVCAEKEFRVASVSVNTPLVCQSLEYPDWTFDSTQEYKESTNPPIDRDVIGLNHNISCSSLNKDGYCQRNKICLATQGEPACACAIGYTWNSGCNNACNKGYYGNKCADKCGNCLYNKSCNETTGVCFSQQCVEGYIAPDCQKTLPYLLNSPQIIKVRFTNATVQLNDISMDGDRQSASHIQIECRIARYNTRARGDPWFNCSDPIKDIKEGLRINIVYLEKETKYEIRAVVYTENGIAFKNNLPTTEIKTECKQLSENSIIINQTSRNVTITFQIDMESCDLNNYKYLLNGVQELLYYKPLVWPNLTPFTYYILQISYEDITIINKTFWTDQDAPSKVQNLECSRQQNEITISWKEPKEKNGQITNYLINYDLQKRTSCPQQIVTNSSTSVSNTVLRYTIGSLQPYTNYTITVIANTIKPGEENTILCQTLIDNLISEDEFPISIFVPQKNISSTSALISFPNNCSNQKGPLFFQISLHCIQDEWCTEVPSNIEDNIENNFITVNDLIPFVNYNVILKAKRAENGEISTITRNTIFQTLGGIPGPVRNFDIYSQNQSSVSVRWTEPWPPRGHLKYYSLSIGGNIVNIYNNKLQLCDLWDIQFYCYTFTGLRGNKVYFVNIYAINEENPQLGNSSYQSTNAAENTPTEPLNLTHNWNLDILNISWNHPNKTNGQLRKFIVHLFPNTTDLPNEDKTPYNYTYNVAEYKKTYTYSFNKTFRYSSSYTVIIYGMNSLKGDNATLYIDTPPEKPELSNSFRVEKTTNSTIIINISGAKANTRSKNSSLYVIVSKKTDVEQNISKIKLADDLAKFATYNESWIAIEQQLSDTNLNITLGDGSKIQSREINNVQVFNKELEPETEYQIIVIPINRYRNQINSKEYYLTVRTSATEIPNNGGLWALLLLLLLPIAGYFVYKHVYKKEDRRNSLMMMIPRLRPMGRSVSEDPLEPDVIPLTEAAGEAVQSKPKRPAVAPKPGPSKTQESPAAEITPNGTNFFHSRIILLENLAEYLKEALESEDLEEQHALFPRGQTKPWNYGTLKPNKFKNRYTNLIAYDHSRVKLEKINNDQHSDYINASYIHGYRQDKAYIATQGPKQATVNDFWRMIWQENVQYIVMLANVIEGGKRKCEKYWPDINSSREYGYIDVYFEKSELYADYEYRTFNLTYKKEKRIVYHLHFTSWPDHGVPMYPQSLVPFLKKILTIPQTTAPVVVHCSAGVGRTGTIILCDICLRMAAREKAVDVLRYLHEIREQRANMVDNSDQYKLVHMVLLECLLAPDTNIPCNAELSQSVQKLIEEGGLQIQLNYLQQSAWQDKALNFVEQKEQDPANNHKNRVPDIVPTENQVYLTRFPVTDEHSDYINAVPVDGFRFKEQFIVTQSPMPNTVNDFWRMVSEKSVKTIVSLNDIPMNDTSCCKFWPEENEEMAPTTKITLKHHKIQIFDYYDVHTILLDDKLAQECFTVQIVQFKGWKSGSKLPQNEENLVLLWEETENLSHGNYPMIVTCYDGATASGLFVAMSFVIEKIKLEQQCDPCLAVRVIRRNRKQFVSNKTQFEFLYRSAVIYLSMFETYSNFQPVVAKLNVE